jgi:hypothetical protein
MVVECSLMVDISIRKDMLAEVHKDMLAEVYEKKDNGKCSNYNKCTTPRHIGGLTCVGPTPMCLGVVHL